MLGIKELINRYRHNRGFGVQSPYAFHIVTSVLKEKHPYYAYSAIRDIARKCGGNASHCRRLFRIANYARPDSIMMIAPDSTAAYAMSAARCRAQTIIDGTEQCSKALNLLRKQGCVVVGDDDVYTLPDDASWMLYVGDTGDYAAAVDRAIKQINDRSVVVVEKIHSTREKEIWWQQIKQNPAVVVTFDLYSMGIMFFDSKYNKQHYTLKM